jgi:hypothetical protein
MTLIYNVYALCKCTICCSYSSLYDIYILLLSHISVYMTVHMVYTKVGFVFGCVAWRREQAVVPERRC